MSIVIVNQIYPLRQNFRFLRARIVMFLYRRVNGHQRAGQQLIVRLCACQLWPVV
jgi:hypothetical protein